ncbi:MAG: precorrin-8X methylmutase [Lachnospiraceae bacterium]|nr:precorrin-8X methylmutase [Lachnospiraceae bacterium]
MEFNKPEDIERESMAIIDGILAEKGIIPDPECAPVLKRVIHTSADFDYVENLRFVNNAVSEGLKALTNGVIVTDTNMALAGINRQALSEHECGAFCYMAEPAVAKEAKQFGTTRAVISMEYAFRLYPHAIFAIGNAPTALNRICDYIERGEKPALVIGVPVGFVNVVESKERALRVCTEHGIPAILALGRKGGSNIAAAICNALLYSHF